MLRLFRPLNQKLLTKHKVGKYLLYAIGEIFLVVIGILIALQVDTWNKARESRAEELKMLKNFRESLTKDSLFMAGSKYTYGLARNSMEYLIGYMEQDLPYTDSLKYHFANITLDWGLQYDFSTFQLLKSSDLNLISNDSLRSDLISYYELAEGLGLRLANRYSRIIEDASKTILSRHFDQMWEVRIDDLQGEMIPYDYQALKKDREFRYFLKTLRNQNYWMIEAPTMQSDTLFLRLVDGIGREIKRLSGDIRNDTKQVAE
ncbi:MAG: DUF6090 family protein [Robiginitalea sp.]